jgi:F0F1-type ATP synthase gamma subunit
MHEVLQELGRAGDLPDHPLLQKREPRIGSRFVLATSDRGLCGSYNMNLIRATAERHPRDGAKARSRCNCICVGRQRAISFSASAATRLRSTARCPLRARGMEDARAVADAVQRDVRQRAALDRVYLDLLTVY